MTKVSHEKMLGELLAVVHRDGGQYVAKHGYIKATLDAMQKVAKLYALLCITEADAMGNPMYEPPLREFRDNGQ